jgi:5'-deoxynucleotidase YfbR-like HD superfamily hydrolase
LKSRCWPRPPALALPFYGKPLNRERLILLCLVHDLEEARTGDLNYVNKKYVKADEAKVAEDIREAYPCGDLLYEALKEYREGTTLESQLAHAADQLEMLLVLKIEMEQGNTRALRWFEGVCKRLTHPIAHQIADTILATPSDSWWFVNPLDPHWIHGGK